MFRAGWFIVGIVLGIVVFAPLAAFLFARERRASCSTAAI
jgi:hypothetical protein